MIKDEVLGKVVDILVDELQKRYDSEKYAQELYLFTKQLWDCFIHSKVTLKDIEKYPRIVKAIKLVLTPDESQGGEDD